MADDDKGEGRQPGASPAELKLKLEISSEAQRFRGGW